LTWPGLIWRWVVVWHVLLFTVTIIFKDDPVIRYSWRSIFVNTAGVLMDVSELKKQMKEDLKGLTK